ncbi:hypothetical protein [uncultured Tateyamaria sp.]|uniref:hypothetical protein n=1 Tax=uncultured Tateyamaria sp. TaxID=455651 RepID=UPI00262DD605|nr:hypothetical protein [uncultured Tateyamaria sp.]
MPASILALYHDAATQPCPSNDVTEHRALLNQLRVTGLRCRVAAHTDLIEACALLTLEGEEAQRTYLGTLVKCLPDALGRRCIWHTPGTQELSFDEAWFVQCITSIRKNDTDSIEFLLRSRIVAADRRYIGFLLAQISDQTAKLE